MTRVHVRRLALGYSIAAGAALIAVACGGGGGGGSPTTPSPGGGTSQPTITITASGAEPKILNIRAGQRVRFLNNDSRTHEMLSTPHLRHDDCRSTNAVGVLAPGADRMTDPMEQAKVCGFHDHQNPDDQRFRGQINVEVTEGPPPGYVRP